MLNNLYTKNFQSNISKSLLNNGHSIYIYNDHLIQNNEVVVNNRPDLSAVKKVDTETLAQARGGIITNETLNEKTINLEMVLQPAGKTTDLVLERREIKRMEDKIKKIFDENGSLAVINSGEMKEVWSAECAKSGTIVGSGAITNLRTSSDCGFQLSNTNFTGEIDTAESNTLSITSISNCEMDLTNFFDVENYKNRPVIGAWIFLSEAEIFSGLNSIKLYLGSSQTDFVAWDTSQLQGSLTNYLGQPLKAGWNFVTLPVSSKMGGNFVPFFGTVGSPDFTQMGKFLFVEVQVSSSQSPTRKISINSLVAYNTNELRAVDCTVANIPTMDRFRIEEGLVVPYNVDLINSTTRIYSPYNNSVLELSTGDPFTDFSFVLDGNGEQFPVVNIAPTSFVNSINLGFTDGSLLTLRKSFSDLNLNFASNDILELDFFNQTFRINGQNAEWQGSFPILKDGDNKGFVKLNYTVGGTDVNFDFETAESPLGEEASPNNGYRNDLSFEIEFTPDIDYFFNSAEVDVQSAGTFSTGQNLRILDENDNVIYSNNSTQDLNLFENKNQSVYLDKDKTYTFKYSKTVFNTVNRQGLPPSCGVVFGATKPTIKVQTKAITDTKFNFVSGVFIAYTDTVFNSGLGACVPSTIPTSLTNSPYLKLNLTRTFGSEFFTDTEFDVLTNPVLTDDSFLLKSNDLDIVYKGNITFASGSPEKIRRFEFKYKLKDGANLTGIVNGGVINANGQITINKTVPENYTITYDSHSLDTATNELTINAITSGEVILNDGEDLDYTFTVKNTSGVNKLFAISGDPELVVADSEIIKNWENKNYGQWETTNIVNDLRVNPSNNELVTAEGDVIQRPFYTNGKSVIIKSNLIEQVLNADGTQDTSFTNLPLSISTSVITDSYVTDNGRLATIQRAGSTLFLTVYEADYSGSVTVNSESLAAVSTGLGGSGNQIYWIRESAVQGVDYALMKWDVPASGSPVLESGWSLSSIHRSILVKDGFVYSVVGSSPTLLRKTNVSDSSDTTSVTMDSNNSYILGADSKYLYVYTGEEIRIYALSTFDLVSTITARMPLSSEVTKGVSRMLDTGENGIELINKNNSTRYTISKDSLTFDKSFAYRSLSGINDRIATPDFNNSLNFFDGSRLGDNFGNAVNIKKYDENFDELLSLSSNYYFAVGEYNGDILTTVFLTSSGTTIRRLNPDGSVKDFSLINFKNGSSSPYGYSRGYILPLPSGRFIWYGQTTSTSQFIILLEQNGTIVTSVPDFPAPNSFIRNRVILANPSSANPRIVTNRAVYDLNLNKLYDINPWGKAGFTTLLNHFYSFDILEDKNKIVGTSLRNTTGTDNLTGVFCIDLATGDLDDYKTFNDYDIRPIVGKFKLENGNEAIALQTNSNIPKVFNGSVNFRSNLVLTLDANNEFIASNTTIPDTIPSARRKSYPILNDKMFFLGNIFLEYGTRSANYKAETVNYTRLITGDIAEDIGTQSSINIRQTPNFI